MVKSCSRFNLPKILLPTAIGLRTRYCIDSDYGKSNVSKCIQNWKNAYKFIDNKVILLSKIPNSDRGYTTGKY